ncbi:hypothetical protein, partial [Chryseobacterium sp. SIMBA_028]|uniref:hypothetical protein n=1 Tax=Chryseobacterium sp. SIMBA_028 TaxID=3085771 RepID=UPI003979D7EC
DNYEEYDLMENTVLKLQTQESQQWNLENESKKVKEYEEKEKDKPEEERKKYIPKNFDYFFKVNAEKFFKYRWKSIN